MAIFGVTGKITSKIMYFFFLGERFHEFSISFLKFVLIVFVRSCQKVEWIAEKVKKSSFCNLVWLRYLEDR